MPNWWDNMQTGFGDALIGVNNPFGLAPPDGYDRNAAMRQGALSLGMSVLANGSDNPAVALGRGYRQAQALASDNQQNALAAQAMMSAAEEKKQKRQEEADQKAQFEGWVKTLPPDQQGLARMFPDKYGAQMVQQQFPDQQGSAGVYGNVYFDEGGNPYALGKDGQFVQPGGLPPGAKLLDPEAISEARARGTMAGGAPKVVIEQYTQKIRPEMSSIADTVTTLNQAKTYLKKGIQTGSMADNIQALRSLGAQLGFNVDERVLADTQSYQNFIGNVVIPRMQALGGNDSNEELKKLYSLSGGDINQSLSALTNTIDFIEQLQRRKFKTLKASEDVALRYIPGLTPIDIGDIAAPPASSGAVPDLSTMSDEELEAIANGQ